MPRRNSDVRTFDPVRRSARAPPPWSALSTTAAALDDEDGGARSIRKGLFLHAYGTGMTGDLRELNILNHYIGMPPVEAPAFETSMFPIGIAVLVVLCLLSPLAPLAEARGRCRHCC